MDTTNRTVEPVNLSNPEIVDTATFDAALDELFNAYFLLSHEVERLPKFSIRGPVVFLLKIYRWMLYLLILPFVLVLMLFLLLISKLVGRPSFKFGKGILKTLATPFISLYHGDISAFRLIGVRAIVGVIAFYRVKKILAKVTLRLQQSQITVFLRNADGDPEKLKWHEQRVSLIKNYCDVIGDALGYAFITSLLGLVGIYSAVKAIVSLLPGSWKNSFVDIMASYSPVNILSRVFSSLLSLGVTHIPVDPSELIDTLSVVGPSQDQPDLLAGLSLNSGFYLVSLVQYMVLIAATNYIDFRNARLSTDIREREKATLSVMGISIPREIPWDALLLLLTFLIQYVFIFRGAQIDPVKMGLPPAIAPLMRYEIIVVFPMTLAVPLFVIYRRLRTDLY
jgi:hypothetical protein